MQTISRLQALRPNLHCLLIGQDGNAYDQPYHSQPLHIGHANLQFDPHRTHWLGSLPENDYPCSAISQVHLHLTVPLYLVGVYWQPWHPRLQS